jgi:hypothetical protein
MVTPQLFFWGVGVPLGSICLLQTTANLRILLNLPEAQDESKVGNFDQ